MILNFMKNSALDTLTADIPNNVALYNSTDKWIDGYFEGKGNGGSYSFSTGIAVPDVDLIIGDSSTDFENSKRIFDSFKDNLNPVQASDLRLWAYLAHNTYWDYMRKRWAIDSVPDDDDDSGTNKAVSRIGSRYFFKASKGKAFVRQGIARLYWGAYLTYDDDNCSDPYEMTEYFFSKQDIFAVSTEHALARNKPLLLGSLKALKEAGDVKRPVIRKFIIRLNQAGGLVVFDSLDKQSAYDLAKRILNEVLTEENSDNVSSQTEAGGSDDLQSPPGTENNTVTESIFTTLSPATTEPEETVKPNGWVLAQNVKTGTKIPISLKKNNFQTKPSLIGMKVGDRFRIRKDTYEIIKIK